MRGSVFPSSRSEGVAEHYVTVAAPESDLKATSLQSGESLAGRQWVWCHKNRNESLMVTKQTLNCFHSGHLNKIRVFLLDERSYLTWHGFIHINLSDSRFIALTSSSGPKRKWTSSDALGFCMCFFSLACRGCSDRYTVRTWGSWWAREVSSCDISPRGWGPASVSADYQWTLLQRGAWLAGSACPLWTNKATMTTRTLQSYRDRTRVSLSGQGS